MFKYAETTTLILAWVLVMSAIWCVVVYYWVSSNAARSVARRRNELGITPSLIIAPTLIVAFHRFFGINLIYPVRYLSTFEDIVWAAIMPAVTLAISGGILQNIHARVLSEFNHWRSYRFVLVGEALGKTPRVSLRRLTVVRSFVTSWAESLPWLFGELVIVEALFNAPGLGLDAWDAAKARDWSLLLEVVGWLSGMYLFAVFTVSAISRWTGRRLETYG